jgi:hypothetical protein
MKVSNFRSSGRAVNKLPVVICGAPLNLGVRRVFACCGVDVEWTSLHRNFCWLYE